MVKFLELIIASMVLCAPCAVFGWHLDGFERFGNAWYVVLSRPMDSCNLAKTTKETLLAKLDMCAINRFSHDVSHQDLLRMKAFLAQNSVATD